MKFEWGEIKEFLALPAAKQIVGGLIIILICVCSLSGTVITYTTTNWRAAEKNYNLCEKSKGEEKLQIQREYSDTVKIIIQRYETEKGAMYQEAIARVEKELDEALRGARTVIATQKRTNHKIENVTSKVSEILTDANK